MPFSGSFTNTTSIWNSYGQPVKTLYASGLTSTRWHERAPSVPKWINFNVADPEETESFSMTRAASGLVSRTRHMSKDTSWVIGRDILVARDPLGRVTAEYSTDTGDTHIGQSFTYDGSNEIQTLVSQVGPAANIRTFNFAYDRRHQLVAATDDKGYDAGFDYSHSGRLKSAYVAASSGAGTLVYPRNVDYVYGGSDPEVVSGLDVSGSPGTPFAELEHDEAGNMIGRGLGLLQWSFAYDSSNRMRRRAFGGTSADELYYYHDDERWLAVERDSAGNPTKARFWFGDIEVTYACDSRSCSRDETRTYMRHGGRTFARVDQDAQGVRKMKVIHDSGLGHTLGVYEAEIVGGVLEYDLELAFQYGPFGETLETLELGTVDANDFLQRFNGKELDPASGLSYYGYRFYDPLSLTWNRSDPLYRFVPDLDLTNPRAASLYTFSRNNPVRYRDPDGREAVEGGLAEQVVAVQIQATRTALQKNSPGALGTAKLVLRNVGRTRDTETRIEVSDKPLTSGGEAAYAITESSNIEIDRIGPNKRVTVGVTVVEPKSTFKDLGDYEGLAGLMVHEDSHREQADDFNPVVRTGLAPLDSIDRANHDTATSEIGAYAAQVVFHLFRSGSRAEELKNLFTKEGVKKVKERNQLECTASGDCGPK